MADDAFAARQRGHSGLRSDGVLGSRPGLTVLLVDPRPWTREGFAQALKSASKDLQVVGVEDVADLAQADVRGKAVTVLNLTGERESECSASSVMAKLHARLPEVPVVALSDRLSAEDILDAIEQGLHGYIPISMEIKLVIDTLRFVAAGGTFVPADLLLAGLAESMSATTSSELATPDAPKNSVAQDAAAIRHRLNALTPRERSVLQVLRQGKSNKHIARELDMCEATVKVHVRHIMRKLGVDNRTQVALLADHIPQF